LGKKGTVSSKSVIFIVCFAKGSFEQHVLDFEGTENKSWQNSKWKFILAIQSSGNVLFDFKGFFIFAY